MFIYQTMISRTSDGLPLSASTDRISPSSQSKINLQEGFQQLKLVCKRATHFADRCSYIVGPLAIYFISALNITYSVLCDVSYPSVLAFSFLNDVQREFLLDYDKSKVDAALRPYSLIAFDTKLQKIKSKYNNPRSLTTRLNLSELSQEIKLRPPFQISAHQIQPELLNDKKNGAVLSRYVSAGIGGRYIPLGVSGCTALFMSALCSALHLLHGFNVLGTGVVDVYDEDFTQYAAAFFISFFLTGFQIYLMLVPVKKKTALAGATLASICLCQLYVWEYKNSIIATLFYVAVASFTTFIICTRRLEEKQKQYML
ncbi:vesicle-trafficking protein SEC22a [Octopus sinensis]|uniref:Vesicle-trafficking protein SEC22a n=1 Tax=Octopus sinensis TaxID=2607531 RepID=A0A6P7T7C5_9MOLL|nr:vesicle-trafficking protein SEC22a [Octopus sinensis]